MDNKVEKLEDPETMTLDDRKNAALAAVTESLKATKGEAYLKRDATDMPLLKGQKLVLTVKVGDSRSGIKWTYLVSTDDSKVSLSHLLRRRNGLPIDGKSNEERLKSLISLFTLVDGQLVLTVKVVDIKYRTTMYEGEEITSQYPIFEVITE